VDGCTEPCDRRRDQRRRSEGGSSSHHFLTSVNTRTRNNRKPETGTPHSCRICKWDAPVREKVEGPSRLEVSRVHPKGRRAAGTIVFGAETPPIGDEGAGTPFDAQASVARNHRGA
jgi:hypothetical protein